MWKRYGAFLVVSGFAFAGGIAGTFLIPRSGSLATAQPAGPTTDPALRLLSERFEQVARQAAPAVVSIEATKPPAAGKTKNLEESGSGVIIRGESEQSSYVITNNHVVTGARADQIAVSLADGRLFRPSQVWADPESDVAVLKIDRGNLPAAVFGDSDRVRVGQWVLAIGSPFGLNQSVTHGIISARERGQISLGGTIRIKDFLQTDAPINPGSSGGPLINLDGEVIGINTAIASNNGSNSGVGFSIPINMVRRVARQLLEKGAVARGYLGLQLSQTFDATGALKLGLANGQGALVETVYPDTPAATAGVKVGDVIVQLDTTAIKSDTHLINMISAMPAGQRVRLQIWRDGRTMTADAVVGDWAQAQTVLKPRQP